MCGDLVYGGGGAQIVGKVMGGAPTACDSRFMTHRESKRAHSLGPNPHTSAHSVSSFPNAGSSNSAISSIFADSIAQSKTVRL
ncbi:hypothetical protein Scep_030546 [Stephania cephalantha]|uniref:Uncharacterized protein n=1 Tax=Stephania cephalantha TaxID=152367 RepID=A0AAP0HIQ3_9MAGN